MCTGINNISGMLSSLRWQSFRTNENEMMTLIRCLARLHAHVRRGGVLPYSSKNSGVATLNRYDILNTTYSNMIAVPQQW